MQEELPYLRRRRQNGVVPVCEAVSVCLLLYSCISVYMSVHVDEHVTVCLSVSVLLSYGFLGMGLGVERVTEARP